MITKINASQAKTMMETMDVTIIDVREEHEYKQGHIKDALLVPLNKIDEHKHKIPENLPVLVYCRSGRRSEIGAKKIESLGFNPVYDFGGILDWPYTIVK